MRIALYAPLKSPDHPVPSGDRTMARLLMRALALAGHEVRLASDLRVFLKAPDHGLLNDARSAAAAEITRIDRLWRMQGAPELWLCYHPYYKSPDLIGPVLCRRFGVAHATVEASWSRRRNLGDWAEAQSEVVGMLKSAAANVSLTARDAAGLEALGVGVSRLPPFVDVAPFMAAPRPVAGHLVTAAMMRPGDKLSSYCALARALGKVPGDWRLSIAGDGPARPEVEAAFAYLGPRVVFHGQLDQPQLAALLAQGSLYLWPGHGEAFGLAALEAQAAGLPVVSENTAGVPEVVQDGETGLLTPEGDVSAYAAAVTGLLADPARRERMAVAARRFAQGERSLERAAVLLDSILEKVQR
ncbi:glycosyltransferase family 4 protein [Paracoccus sp. NGMCC 1.201697]|uniref:Glycosyltransferase family 4 protein n=1 Tax=Paracoccus broussonetiae subsp. drimophilus TaxID=3373869 RepID=A0ABW7LNW8_9RHOB